MPETVAQRLVRLRADKLRRRVAKDMGISYSMLLMYEIGYRTPKDEVKKKIAAYYRCSVEDLFYRDLPTDVPAPPESQDYSGMSNEDLLLWEEMYAELSGLNLRSKVWSTKRAFFELTRDEMRAEIARRMEEKQR